MSNALQISTIVLGALIVAAIVGAVAWLVARRAATGSAGELRRALDRADLNVSIDLDEVLDRIAKITGSLPGVDAVVVSVEDRAGGRIVSAAGMTLEQAQTQVFSTPPDVEAQSMSVSYRYAESDHGQLRSALVLPLVGESGPVGFLAIYSGSRDQTDAGDDIGDELADVARRAGPAVNNALRFREARRMADLDALTGLHNRRYFHEILAREVARAHRYDRRLGLVLLDLDDFKAINERIGHLAGDSVLAEAAERMLSVVRGSDVPCRVGGDEFAVILPESGLAQADQLYRRIQAAVSGRPVGQVPHLDLSAGVAELAPSDDANSLFERADDALYRAKNAGKARAFPAIVPELGTTPEAGSNSGVG
jgi:diguanylate cyclase (GGDEF)-like protein